MMKLVCLAEKQKVDSLHKWGLIQVLLHSSDLRSPQIIPIRNKSYQYTKWPNMHKDPMS